MKSSYTDSLAHTTWECKYHIVFVPKFRRKEIYIIDRKQNYPIDLGDYDIIAIDDISKRIWIIESKVLNRVGSFYEMLAQQRNSFQNINMMRNFKEE